MAPFVLSKDQKSQGPLIYDLFAVSNHYGSVGFGLLAGLTGTGGGIFLTPWMLWKKWAPTKTVAAVSVIFILVNSISGLAGYVSSARSFPQVGWNLLAVAILGGWVGSRWGSRHYSPLWIQRLLAMVLLIAGGKLIFIP